MGLRRGVSPERFEEQERSATWRGATVLFSAMRKRVLLAVACATALAPTTTGTSAVVCQVAPPKTVSPTNSRLWTAAHHGEWVAAPQYVNADGSMWLKAPWFSAGPRGNPRGGPRGVLTITGRRLDAFAPSLTARTRQVGVSGFGGSGVWAAVITFPAEGCWAVTGRVERTRHSFRLLVTRQAG